MVQQYTGWLPRLDPHSAVPLFQQVVEQVALAVASGELEAGQLLPSVRTLATELRINPNTAARAMRELESAGLSRSRRGVGSVVEDDAATRARQIANEVLQRELDGAIGVGRALNLTIEELQTALSERWGEE